MVEIPFINQSYLDSKMTNEVTFQCGVVGFCSPDAIYIKNSV